MRRLRADKNRVFRNNGANLKARHADPTSGNNDEWREKVGKGTKANHAKLDSPFGEEWKKKMSVAATNHWVRKKQAADAGEVETLHKLRVGSIWSQSADEHRWNSTLGVPLRPNH